MNSKLNFLNETYDQWMEAVRAGSAEYIMVARRKRDDLWYLVTAGEAHVISQISIAIDEGDGRDYRLEYAYSDDMHEGNIKLWSGMVICGDKIIIEDSHGLYAFGFEDIPTPAKGFLIKLHIDELGDMDFEFRNEAFELEDKVYVG